MPRSESKKSDDRRMSAEDGQPEGPTELQSLDQEASARLNVFDEEERKEREERRKNREPPIVFKDAVDVSICQLLFNREAYIFHIYIYIYI